MGYHRNVGTFTFIVWSFTGMNLLKYIVTNYWSSIGMILLEEKNDWYEFDQIITNKAPTYESAEKAEPSETPWHTYDGTPTAAWLHPY